MSTYQHVFFEPHVGSRYGKPASLFNNRILVLGDSHYCRMGCLDCGNLQNHSKCSSFTLERVVEYLEEQERDRWMATYSTFINTVFRRGTSHGERETFFESVAFYNYLQKAAGTNSESASAYAAEYNQESHLLAFYEVLENLMPELVIIWGNRVWNALPNNLKGYGEATKGAGIKIGPKIFTAYYDYPFNGRRVLLIGAQHPCRGTSVAFNEAVFDELGVTPMSGVTP